MQTELSRNSLEQPEMGLPARLQQSTHKDKPGIFKIQRTCVHDGPGLRTTIFMRGCGLSCIWCQNPESLSLKSDPENDPQYSIADVVEIVARDKDYFDLTGGGVTLSGGDPLLQNPATLIPLLQALKDKDIHVAVETGLHVPWEHIEAVKPFVSLFLIDLKIVGDEERHRQYTKQSDKLIHSNISKLVESDAPVKFRMVMVPGYNDGDSQLKAAAEFLKALGYDAIELLKYHNMYEEKARRLGIERESLNITNDQALASVKRAVGVLAECGIKAECYDLDAARNKAAFTQRVLDIQKAIRESEYHICFEVSNLKTEFYKNVGFERPAHIHRAQRLDYVLGKKQIIVYPGELLVGNFTSKRRAGQVWEEHCGAMIGTIIHQIDKQEPIPFKCTTREKINFYRKIMPFWYKHSIMGKVYPSIKDLKMMVARCSEMNTGFNNNMASIAHFIINYERLLKLGTTGLIKEVEEARKAQPGKDQDFYSGVIIALKALEMWADRHAEKLDELSRAENDPVRRRELEEMAAICRYIPRNPARTYHEALQCMLFLHIAVCIESFENAISPGRLDQILYPYYIKDKQAGIIDYEKAKELLALFILKMDEAIFVNDGNTYLRIGRLFETMSTDQTVTAGGLDKDGNDATNDLTYALLDICELQPYSVNMTARIHKNSPPEYLDRLAEVYINGSPMPALYNDEIYIDTLQRHYDTSLEEARNYAIVGCVEPNASDDHFGNTDCANMNVTLPLLQALKGEEDDLWNFGLPEQIEKIATKFVEYNFEGDNLISRTVTKGYGRLRSMYKNSRKTAHKPPADMSELLKRFQKRLNVLANAILADHQKIEKIIRENFPTPLTSALSKGCIEKGIDANSGGARHNSCGIQAVGITDAADSLYAINEVVFKKKLYTLNDVIEAIESDFAGERNRQIREALLAVPKFGQDESQEAIDWVNRTLQIYVNALNQVPGCPRNGRYSAGYYALNVSDVYGKKTPSLPSGRLKGTPLANSVAPHYGMKATDLFSSLNSVAGVDFAKYAPNGTTVTFTIDSALFQGREGVRNLAGIFSTFFKKGGMQFQPNVISREILLDAYKNPDKYPYLLVRVAGYCSYFNQLSDDLKKIIINRTCYS